MPTFLVTKEVVIEINVDPKVLTPQALELYEKYFHPLGPDKEEALMKLIAYQCAMEYTSQIEGVGPVNEADRGGTGSTVTYKVLDETVTSKQVE